MTQANVAVVGPLSFITPFELGGIKGIPAETAEEAVKSINKLLEANDLKLIILPERFINETKQLRETIQKKSLLPIILLIPDTTMITGMRLEELRTAISAAIGTQIDL